MRKITLLILIVFLTSSHLNADSQLIHNSENGHWYQRFDESMSWHDAKDFCEAV